MASLLLSLVVLIVISAATANVDASKCPPGMATCTKGKTCGSHLWSDPNNCGQCGSNCTSGPHATSKCKMGRCSFECDKKNGWCDCDGKRQNGCEVNSQWDKSNCGGCGRVCLAPPNSVASCVQGVCKKECKYGYKQCGNSCVKVASDVNNCGACGTICPGGANGNASCAGGMCDVQCKAGYVKCKGICVNVDTNVLNCGRCGNVCPMGLNGITPCVGGICDVNCKSGYKKCNGTCIDLTVDVGNCGLCGTKCPEDPNGMASCIDATCDLKCTLGFTKCQGKCVKTSDNILHCGGCETICSGENGTPFCIGGTCDLDCKSGYTKCNGKCIDLNTNVENCGFCETMCSNDANNVASCVGGTCILSCGPGYTECYGRCVNFNTDFQHCGSCDFYCGRLTANECIDGQCICTPEMALCNGTLVDLNADVFNCGSCGGFCETTHCPCGICRCFPGDAIVTLATGATKWMRDLALGDKVAVWSRDGGVAYEDVYAFGLQDASASASFVQLTVKPMDIDMLNLAAKSRTLELTTFHFVPISAGLAGSLTYKRAGDVIVGDRMWADGSAVVEVIGISQVQKQGLYKPFTLGGTIIVNGVVASTHSGWFLDGVFEALGLVEWLPWAYQALLLPVRTLYCVLGKDVYIALYQRLDAVVDVAAFGGKHGGSVATAAAALGLFVMAKASWRA